jgi:hypothetical protein
MLVPLIPPPIHHFRDIRIVRGTFEGGQVGLGQGGRGSGLGCWLRYRVVWFGRGVVFGGCRWLRRKIEEESAVRAAVFVDDEVVEFVVLWSSVNTQVQA